MKKLTILGFICLALMLTALPFMACAEEEPAPVTPAPVTPAPVTPAPAPVVVPAPAGEPEFTVLDPRGIEAERDFLAISPRLDTLSGKKVGVINLHGGNDIVMTTIAPAIKALVPDCDAVYWYAEIEYHRPRTEGDWAFIESCDAVIIGHDY